MKRQVPRDNQNLKRDLSVIFLRLIVCRIPSGLQIQNIVMCRISLRKQRCNYLPLYYLMDDCSLSQICLWQTIHYASLLTSTLSNLKMPLPFLLVRSVNEGSSIY